MALAEAILVCLTERDMSGYDLAKHFDTSIGFFWRATHPQIYRELHKLKDKGFVSASEHIQQGKPNRTIYTLTDDGRSALDDWSMIPVGPPSVKDDLLVRLYALGDIDSTTMREHIQIRRAQHGDKLQRYQKIESSQYTHQNLDQRQRGKLMALKLGIRYETCWIEWCDETIAALDQNNTVTDLSELRASKYKPTAQG